MSHCPRRTPEARDAFVAEVGSVSELDVSGANARQMVERLAQAPLRSLVVERGPSVADAFVARRGGQAYGTLPVDVDFTVVINRHGPT